MKKIICCILLLACVLSLLSCSVGKYDPVDSTDEERRVMMTLSFEGEEYEVRYELYRALFLNFSAEYADEGDGYFDTEEGAAALSEINARIVELVTDIYGALHLAKKTGFDPYSRSVDEEISELIAADVDSDHYGGDYEKYLAELKRLNMNYAVQDLILRYQLAYDHIIEYYTGTIDFDNPSQNMTEGALEFTKDDVRDFYFSDDSVRVSVITVNYALPYADALRIRDNIAAKADSSAALNYAISCTISDPDDIFNGVVIGNKSVDYVFYGDVKSAAFKLGVGDTSEVIEITRNIDADWWILYGLDKTEEHFEECYDDIQSAYVSHKIGLILDNVKTELAKSIAETDTYKNLVHSEIGM